MRLLLSVMLAQTPLLLSTAFSAPELVPLMVVGFEAYRHAKIEAQAVNAAVLSAPLSQVPADFRCRLWLDEGFKVTRLSI